MIKVLLLFLLTFSAQAEQFESSFLKFNLPSGFKCSLKGKVWLCRHQTQKIAREGFITVRAKLSSPLDSVNDFLRILEKPKTRSSKKGKISLSKVYSASKKKIGNDIWVESLHLGSTIPRYFTQYFVTTKGDLSIAVDLNFHQSLLKKYSAMAEEMSYSLEIKSTMATEAKAVVLPQATPDFPTSPVKVEQDKIKVSNFLIDQQIYLAILAGLFILFGLFTLMRTRPR